MGSTQVLDDEWDGQSAVALLEDFSDGDELEGAEGREGGCTKLAARRIWKPPSPDSVRQFESPLWTLTAHTLQSRMVRMSSSLGASVRLLSLRLRFSMAY